jgi:hypothetical protein
MEEGKDLWYFETLGYLWTGALGKPPKTEIAKEILTIDRDQIHGNRSCSSETWHSRRVESVDSLELPKPELLFTISMNPCVIYQI